MASSIATQGNGLDGQHVSVAGSEAQTKRVRRGATVVSAVVLVGASAVFAVMMLTATPSSAAQPFGMSGDLPGMSQDGGHGSTPTPTMASEMPGMDHGDGHGSTPSPTTSADGHGTDHGDGHGSTPSPTTSADGHGTEHGSADKPGANTGHSDAATVATDRPVAAVLGTFGGASSAVMLSAAFLRRKDRAISLAKQAARAARKAQK